MKKTFPHKIVEKKWIKYWQDNNTFKTAKNPKNKKYILDMFPYPSGEGLHVGHIEGYAGTDTLARYYRMNKYDVMHPMGWDSFGLPAENYAIKEGKQPKDTTSKNIERFRKQMDATGLSYDWNLEISTSSPEYYKWTQWIFIKLFEKGLAYQKEASVNWCEGCQTVLANEQVVNGECERCHGKIVQKDMKQWFFKITDYAERLLNGLDKIDWPESIKVSQRNWIGKSIGASLEFSVQESKEIIEVFTTRPDTLYGATYMVLAPEHKLIKKLVTKEKKEEVEKYITAASNKSELHRTQLQKEKTGVFIGSYAINPVNKKAIPIYIADYVMSNYGTGAIMAVPAHDKRDFEFATKYNLEIIPVIEGFEDNKAYEGRGKLLNSDEFNGLDSQKAKSLITKKAGGRDSVNYKLRDWLISRQRYWGAPIPIVHCDKCGPVAVEESYLPVELPEDIDFNPKGYSPLADSDEFVNTVCPKCGAKAKRETDTMDTFVCSSWYYLRYPSTNNNEKIFGERETKEWLPVDIYVGGAEHAVLHLLYARFFTKFFKDIDLIDFEEPFTKLRHVGVILGPDNQKMSKSKGNVINPDDVIDEYGADVLRLHELFMGPFSDEKPWNTESIVGSRRFVDRFYALAKKVKEVDKTTSAKMAKALNKTIKKVTEDTERYHFNTAISSMMELIAVCEKNNIGKEDFSKFIAILSIYAPFVSNEAWKILGKEKLENALWPEYDKDLIAENEVNIAVQVNGKLRGTFTIGSSSTKDEQEVAAMKVENVVNYINGRKVIKSIVVPGKIVNLIVN